MVANEQSVNLAADPESIADRVFLGQGYTPGHYITLTIGPGTDLIVTTGGRDNESYELIRFGSDAGHYTVQFHGYGPEQLPTVERLLEAVTEVRDRIQARMVAAAAHESFHSQTPAGVTESELRVADGNR